MARSSSSGGPLTVTNSTFSSNSAASSAGGIYSFNSTLSYANTIIANSTGGDCEIGIGGTIGTNTNNLVEDGSCSASLSGDPSLGALADNGGATQTIALLAGSSAINAGNNSTCAAALVNRRDQRGVARPNGPRCDIGAYEYVDTSAPTVTAFTVPSPSSSLTIQPTAFTAADDVGVTGYMITESATPPAAGAAGWSPSVVWNLHGCERRHLHALSLGQGRGGPCLASLRLARHRQRGHHRADCQLV